MNKSITLIIKLQDSLADIDNGIKELKKELKIELEKIIDPMYRKIAELPYSIDELTERILFTKSEVEDYAKVQIKRCWDIRDKINTHSAYFLATVNSMTLLEKEIAKKKAIIAHLELQLSAGVGDDSLIENIQKLKDEL